MIRNCLNTVCKYVILCKILHNIMFTCCKSSTKLKSLKVQENRPLIFNYQLKCTYFIFV